MCSHFITRLIKCSLKLKNYIVNAVNRNIKNYLRNSSINCYQYLVDERLHKWERIIWWTLHVSAMVLVGWLISTIGTGSTIALTRNAIGSTLKYVPFPGISVCSLNRISKKRTIELMNTLKTNESIEYSSEELFNILGYLGFAYDLEYPETNEFKILNTLMEHYDFEEILKFLTPNCDELLERCMWRNREINCTRHFSLQKTMDGYCCVFNNSEKDVPRNQSMMPLPGIENGFSLLLNQKLDDYTFKTFHSEGIKILIFKPGDYPDISSGECTQMLLTPRTLTYIALDAIHISGNTEFERLPLLLRGCIFASDRSYFKDSYSDCIMRCRKRSVRRMCLCIPFFLPLDKLDYVCELSDMICLKQWKESWAESWSGENVLFATDSAVDDVKVPPCQYCIPSCEEDKYSARHHVIPLDIENTNSAKDNLRSKLLKGIRLKDHSIVNIYFQKNIVTHLIYIVLSTWYNLLSYLGGICGLILGGSLISLAEFIYFLLGGSLENVSRKKRKIVRSLYWREFPN